MAGKEHSDRAVDFSLQEHSALREEVRGLMVEARDLERNVVIAIGAILAFLALHDALAQWWTWWLAPAFALLGTVRNYSLHLAFRQYARYLKQIEKRFYGNQSKDGVQGWEHFLDLKNEKRVWVIGWLFWGLLLAVTAVVAILQSRPR